MTLAVARSRDSRWRKSMSVVGDTGWSRRRALQTAGAALVSAVGIAEHAADAGAQSTAASPAVAATPTIPADFKVVLHTAEVQNWPYVLSNLRNLTQEWPQAQLRVVLGGDQPARNEQPDDGVCPVRRSRRPTAGLSECAARTRDRASHDSGFRPDESWRCGGAGIGTTRRICVRQAIAACGVAADRRLDCRAACAPNLGH
jgi:hypothetical protein